MTSLSIVERELRVRARQRFTSWIRVGVAATAMLISLMWLQYTSRSSPAETSRMVFSLLTWLCFALCLFEGARQTADTLSGEKREGTLGLLFLTDLGGLDITLGKFAAASVQSFYGLLAVFPVLGITLAVGGVTAGEFWRTQLALLTTLFLAAAGGLWVSARSHDELRAVLAVVGLMLGLAAKTTGQAVGRALLLVMFVPWIAGTALSLLVAARRMPILPGSPWWQWLVFASGSLVSFAWFVGLIVWARRRLFHRFRETAAGELLNRPRFLTWPRKTSLAGPVSA